MSPERAAAVQPGQARHVAVIDIGKTNAKVVLHDLGSRADLTVRTMPNTVRRDGPYPHHDADALHAFILASLKAFAAERPIDAVSITTHGAAGALVGEEALVLPILDYEHDLSGPATDDYARLRPDFAESFSPRLPNGLNLGNQVYWLQRSFPSEFARVRHVLGYPQYWAFRLTGVVAREVTSLGCHTDLWAPERGDFSSMVDRLGWRPLFAPERSPFDVAGMLSPEIVEAIGLSGGTKIPVHCGIHDSNASLLPHILSRKAPFSVVSTGTWIVSFAIGGRKTDLDPARDMLVNVDAFGRPVPSSLFMGGREFDLLTRNAAVEPDAAAVDAVIEGGVMALPTFAPNTGPYPGATGYWTVDPETLSAKERTAAASLYAALVVRTALDLIGGDGPTMLEGPFGRNHLFASTLAKLTGRPVHAVAGATGTSAGAALLAAGPEGRHELPDTGAVFDAHADPALLAYAATWRRLAESGRLHPEHADHPLAAVPPRDRTAEL